MKMTDEQINIAIAKACGWKHTNECPINGKQSVWFWLDPNGTKRYYDLDVPWLPDFCNDLNAMHEAEKALKLGLRNTYDAELDLVSKRDYCFIWETTARQRAEAFLRVKGKWQE